MMSSVIIEEKMMESKSIEKVFDDLLCMTRYLDHSPDWAHGLKLGEECGEVLECILKGNGFLAHKSLKEDVLHEVADVMNTCCALLTSHYPDMVPDDILDALANAMIKKGEKYKKVLTSEDNFVPLPE